MHCTHTVNHNTTQHNTTNCVGPFLTPFQLSGEEAAVGGGSRGDVTPIPDEVW